MIVQCSKCGQNYDTKSHILKIQGWCFYCNFWSEIASRRQDYLIIDGHSYCKGEEDDVYKGMGGRLFYIETNDGWKFKTTNLWHQGKIPDVWRDALPDNARFTNSEGFDEATQSFRSS